MFSSVALRHWHFTK